MPGQLQTFDFVVLVIYMLGVFGLGLRHLSLSFSVWCSVVCLPTCYATGAVGGGLVSLWDLRQQHWFSWQHR